MSSLSGVGSVTSKVFQVILTPNETTLIDTYFSELMRNFPNLQQHLKPEQAVEMSVAALLSLSNETLERYKFNCTQADPTISAFATIIFRHFDKLKASIS